MRAALAAGAFFACFAWGIGAAYPAVAPLDSGELTAVGATLGVAHSPGYPLFSLAAKAWHEALPFGNGAYRANLFSAFCSALAVAALVWVLGAESPAAGLAAGLALWASPAFRREAVATEVFALNTLWAAVLAAFLLAPLDRRRLWLASFWLGLGLGNQHTLLPAGAGLAVAAWAALSRRERPAAGLAAAAAFFALGLSVYLFIPLRASAGPALNWEEPTTLGRFWDLVTRARYGTLALAQGGSETAFTAPRVLGSLSLFAGLLAENLGWIGLLAALLGAAALARQRPWAAAALGAAFVLTGPAFFVLSKMLPGENARTIMERFLPLPLVFASVCAGWAFTAAPRRAWSPALALLLLLRAWEPVCARGRFAVHDFGLAHLRAAPRGATLIVDRADEAEFSLAWLHLADGRRPDVRLIDGNAGVTPSVYGDDYYRVWGPPRLARRDAVESALIAEAAGPVFYATLEPHQLPVRREREGILWRAKGPPRPVAWGELLALRAGPGLPRRERFLAASLRSQLAVDALELGRGEEAERHWRAAEALTEDPAGVRAVSGVERLTRGRHREAARDLERALALRPDPQTWSNLGVAREQAGDAAGAAAAHREAVRLDAAFAQGWKNLGAVCWKLSDWACAEDAFARAAKLDPADEAARGYRDSAARRRR